MKQTIIKNEKGITLISLVITIILMLILVTVTISLALNGGLFEYSKKAALETNEKIVEEQEFGDTIIEKYLLDSYDITINKNSLEDIKTQQLSISEKMLNGGTWSTRNPQVATVDESGNVTWQSIGKTTIVYEDSNHNKELFNIKCTYSIAASTQGWEVLHDCGQYGDSINYNDAYSFVTVGYGSNNDYEHMTYACAGGGYGVYHTTIYRTIDLTNVSLIKFKGYYHCNANGTTVSTGYKSGLVKDNEVSANCVYDTNYNTVKDITEINTTVAFDLSYNVSSLSGNHIFAFTATHPDCHQNTTCAGYVDEILLEP